MRVVQICYYADNKIENYESDTVSPTSAEEDGRNLEMNAAYCIADSTTSVSSSR